MKNEIEVTKTTHQEVTGFHTNNTHRVIHRDLEGYTTGRNAIRVVHDNPDLRGGFTQVPNIVLYDPLLKVNAKLCYIILLAYARQERECWPSQQLMAEQLGLSQRTAIRALKELQRKKLVRIERLGQGKHNIYHIKRLSDGYLPSQLVDK